MPKDETKGVTPDPQDEPAKEKSPRVEKTHRAAPVIIRPYVEGRWHGLTNYHCKTCKYATLDKDEILAHVADCAARR